MDFSILNPEHLTEKALELLNLFIVLGSSILLGLIIKAVVIKLLRLYGKRAKTETAGFLANRLNHPFKVFIPLALILLSAPLFSSIFTSFAILIKYIEVFFYGATGWALIGCVYVFSDVLMSKYQIDEADNLKERRVVTQIQFIRKILIILIAIVFISIILLSFDVVRKLGAGILTSAGIMGIIIGLAAQKSISNLLAGVQIAFSQPIRIDDVLVVENEWGRVEEITLTYVVVRIWDLRRLILPLNYFIDNPFQNWTRSSADILGSVMLWVDYKLPIEPIRQELTKILKSSDYWDGKVNVIHVIDATERAVQIRALMSTRSSSDGWELRCIVREKLIAFIQTQYPEYLPKVRTEVTMISPTN